MPTVKESLDSDFEVIENDIAEIREDLAEDGDLWQIVIALYDVEAQLRAVRDRISKISQAALKKTFERTES